MVSQAAAPRTLAITMNDCAHSEAHFLCQAANAAQSVFRFREINWMDEPMWTAPRVELEPALRRLHQRKRELGLGDDDILVGVVSGNLYDDRNDEYLFRTSAGVPELAGDCVGVGIVSLHYRLQSDSEFLRPRTAKARAWQAAWWEPKPEAEKAVVLGNSFLLLLMGLLPTLAAGLTEHDEDRGCVLDYCQDPFEMLRLFERGIAFPFCRHQCRPALERTEQGRAILAIAERLGARPYGQPQPSVFISYAREDDAVTERLLLDLKRAGYEDVWKDRWGMVPGVPWEDQIRQRLTRTNFCISCLSAAGLSRAGYFHEELRIALEMQQAGKLHVIPVRIDACALPEPVAKLHVPDLFPDWAAGLEAIRNAITFRYRPFYA